MVAGEPVALIVRQRTEGRVTLGSMLSRKPAIPIYWLLARCLSNTQQLQAVLCDFAVEDADAS